MTFRVYNLCIGKYLSTQKRVMTFKSNFLRFCCLFVCMIMCEFVWLIRELNACRGLDIKQSLFYTHISQLCRISRSNNIYK